MELGPLISVKNFGKIGPWFGVGLHKIAILVSLLFLSAWALPFGKVLNFLPFFFFEFGI